MPSSETFQLQEPPSSKPDSPKPESHLTLNELSPEVQSLAVNVSKRILALCKKHGIGTVLDISQNNTSLSQAVSDSVEKFIEKLPTDPLLMPDAKQILALQQFLTSLHEQDDVPTDSEFVSTTAEEALRGGVLYHKGDLDLSDLTSAEGIVFPETVVGNLNLNGLVSAKGLVLPTTITRGFGLNGLTSAEGLSLPSKIGGDLYLGGLKRATGLVLSEEIGGDLYLGGLDSAQDLKLPQTITGGLDLSGLTSAKGLILPETMGGYLDLRQLTSIDGLILPNTIKGSLFLYGLTSAKGLILPMYVNGRVRLDNIPEWEKEKLRNSNPNLTIV